MNCYVLATRDTYVNLKNFMHVRRQHLYCIYNMISLMVVIHNATHNSYLLECTHQLFMAINNEMFIEWQS